MTLVRLILRDLQYMPDEPRPSVRLVVGTLVFVFVLIVSLVSL